MKKHILIVDDEQLLLNSMQRDLREFENKFDIHVTTNSNNTLRLIEELDIDLLITDIFMPDKDGIELTREVMAKYPAVKIIAMSGRGKFGKVDYLEFAKHFGSMCTLSKPFSREELISSIQYALRESV